MAFVAAKCPSCNAAIQVPDEVESVFCAYCGTQIKTKAAIGYMQVELKGKVQIDTSPEVQLKLRRGRETGDIKYFMEALDLDPDCYEARLEVAKVNNLGCYSRILFDGRIYYGKDPIKTPRDIYCAEIIALKTEHQQELIKEAAKFAQHKERYKQGWFDRLSVGNHFALYYEEMRKAIITHYSFWIKNDMVGEYKDICRYSLTAFYEELKKHPLSNDFSAY